MLFTFLLILIVAVTGYFLYQRYSSRGFQEACGFTPTARVEPKQIEQLVAHAQDQINKKIASYTETVKMGPIRISGIGAAQITHVDLGPRSKILPCTSECVCKPSEVYEQSAAVHLEGATATIEAPDIEMTLFGGIKARTPIKIVIQGIDGIIETDCNKSLTVTAASAQNIIIEEPVPDSKLGRLLAAIPDHKGKLASALEHYVIGKKFYLSDELKDTPLLCNMVEQ